MAAKVGPLQWLSEHLIAPIIVGIIVGVALLAAGVYFTFLKKPSVEEGYVYYGRNNDGTPSRSGQLRLIDDSLPLASELHVGNRFISVGEKELHPEAFDKSRPITLVPAGTCFLALGIKNPPKAYDEGVGGAGVWLNVRVIDCPPRPS